MFEPERELSFSEKATWGTCPACEASHGEKCYGAIGFPLGKNINGQIDPDGAHLGRLRNSPNKVREVAIN